MTTNNKIMKINNKVRVSFLGKLTGSLHISKTTLQLMMLKRINTMATTQLLPFLTNRKKT